MSFKYLQTVLMLSFIVLFSFTKTRAQEIHFTSPTNGQEVTDANYSDNQIPINIQYSYTRSPNPNYIYAEIKLVTDNGSYGYNENEGVPQWLYRVPGTYTWRIELWEGNVIGTYKTAEQTITFYTKFLLTFSNNVSGGLINVNGTQQNSGYTLKKFVNEQIQLGAIDQSIAGRSYIWNTSGIYSSNWERRAKGDLSPYNIPGAVTRNYTYTVVSNDNSATISAGLRKILNITFQNNFGSDGNGGTIKVNGTSYNSPASNFNVTEQNPISATAVDQTINYTQYIFSNWSNGSTTRTTTFYPGLDTTYTANFVEHVGVYISGPITPPCSTATWTAHVYGGFSPYHYQWYDMTNCSGGGGKIRPMGHPAVPGIPLVQTVLR